MIANRLLSAVSFAAMLALSLNAQATPMTFTVSGTGANAGLQASADFDIVGGDLVVTLHNTSGMDITAPGQILEAMFFNIRNDVNLSLVSAVINSGSDICDFGNATPCTPDGGASVAATDVNGGWAYVDNMGGAVNGATRGVGAAGLNIFGPGPGGMAYGVLSQGDNTSTYNGGMVNGSPFVKDSVQFKYQMSGAGAGNVQAVGDLQIADVSFNYGTSLNTIPSIPAPSTGALFGLGLALAAVIRRRRVGGAP